MEKNIFKILDLRSLKFKYRKVVHYSLLVSVIMLQVLLLVILYNEFVNEPKLEKFDKQLKNLDRTKEFINLSREDYIKIQSSLQDFIKTKENRFLDNYYLSIRDLKSNFDSIKSFTNRDLAFDKFVVKEDSASIPTEKLERKIDSLIRVQLVPNSKLEADLLKLKKYDYKDVLKSVDVETYLLIDSVERKGLLSRIGDAIAGKVAVQKEKLKVVVTMKYGKKVTTGNIEEQLANAFKNTNNYYQGQFSNLKDNLNNYRNTDSKFLLRNDELLGYNDLLLSKYDDALELYTKAIKEDFNAQYQINKKIRNYSIIGLVLFLIVISGILILLTRLAFDYEKRLLNAQEKIQQNLSFKNRIVGMISHEIRSPLNIISIYSNSISKKIKDEELKSSFKTIQHTTVSLSMLANQILEYSKNENKKLELNKSTFNLKQELSGFLKSLKKLVEDDGNKIEFDCNISEEFIVNSDKVKIHQLFYNIVGNANKFTENGIINIKLDIQQFSSSQYNLFIEIEDNGKGMSENDLKSVFESYYQGVVSEKVHNLGVGLGLNLCKELVELFNGEIKIESKINQGTKVNFNLILDKINK